MNSLKSYISEEAKTKRYEQEKFISIVKPTRCTISQIYFILEQHSTCFGRSFRASIHRTCMVRCSVYSLRLLMLDGKTVWNM